MSRRRPAMTSTASGRWRTSCCHRTRRTTPTSMRGACSRSRCRRWCRCSRFRRSSTRSSCACWPRIPGERPASMREIIDELDAALNDTLTFGSEDDAAAGTPSLPPTPAHYLDELSVTLPPGVRPGAARAPAARPRRRHRRAPAIPPVRASGAPPAAAPAAASLPRAPAAVSAAPLVAPAPRRSGCTGRASTARRACAGRRRRAPPRSGC